MSESGNKTYHCKPTNTHHCLHQAAHSTTTTIRSGTHATAQVSHNSSQAESRGHVHMSTTREDHTPLSCFKSHHKNNQVTKLQRHADG